MEKVPCWPQGIRHQRSNFASSYFSPFFRLESESEVAQSCLTLCDPMDCSLSGSSIHGIFQARVLEWISISFSRGSSQPRNRTRVSCIAGRRFILWDTREAFRLEEENKGVWRSGQLSRLVTQPQTPNAIATLCFYYKPEVTQQQSRGGKKICTAAPVSQHPP